MFRYVIEVSFTDSVFVRVDYPYELPKDALATQLYLDIEDELTPNLLEAEIADGICSYLKEITGTQRLEDALRANIRKGSFRLRNVRNMMTE